MASNPFILVHLLKMKASNNYVDILKKVETKNYEEAIRIIKEDYNIDIIDNN